MVEKLAWKAKWGRAADLPLPFPSPGRSGRFSRRREKTEIETLDVGNAHRASKAIRAVRDNFSISMTSKTDPRGPCLGCMVAWIENRIFLRHRRPAFQ